MKLDSTVTILIVVAVIILIVLVLGIVRFKVAATAAVGRSPSPQETHRHQAHAPAVAAPNTKAEYETVHGPEVKAAAPVVAQDLNRHKAKAGKPQSIEVLQQQIRGNSNFKQESRVIVEQDSRPLVHTPSIAELFSIKEDVEAEFGVTEAEMAVLVEKYKKSKEFVDRPLPVSRHFNIEDYKESRVTLRQSAKNLGINHASKRGQITKAIYKTYGKHFSDKKVQATPEVFSKTVGNAEHRAHREAQKDSRAQGHLVIR